MPQGPTVPPGPRQGEHVHDSGMGGQGSQQGYSIARVDVIKAKAAKCGACMKGGSLSVVIW